jgi:hypothetical protein
MDLIDYLLQHLSVNKLVTAMKDRVFVLANSNSHLSPTHFPYAQLQLHLPSSPPHHVPAPPPEVQTFPPQTAPAPAPTQLLQGGERAQPPSQHGAERERERERVSERETDGCSQHSLMGACWADQPCACQADHSSNSASAQPSHRSSLANSFPY